MKITEYQYDKDTFVGGLANHKLAYSVNEAAELTGIGRTKLRKLIRKGHLKALDIGGLKIRAEELQRFLAEAEGKDYSDVENVRNLNMSDIADYGNYN